MQCCIIQLGNSSFKMRNKLPYSAQKILCEKFKSQVINFQIIVILNFANHFLLGIYQKSSDYNSLCTVCYRKNIQLKLF
jgi:hypothetical protein